MIREDLDWLLKQPRTLEREHIEVIVKRSVEHEYGALEERDRLRELLERAKPYLKEPGAKRLQLVREIDSALSEGKEKA